MAHQREFLRSFVLFLSLFGYLKADDRSDVQFNSWLDTVVSQAERSSSADVINGGATGQLVQESYPEQSAVRDSAQTGINQPLPQSLSPALALDQTRYRPSYGLKSGQGAADVPEALASQQYPSGSAGQHLTGQYDREYPTNQISGVNVPGVGGSNIYPQQQVVPLQRTYPDLQGEPYYPRLPEDQQQQQLLGQQVLPGQQLLPGQQVYQGQQQLAERPQFPVSSSEQQFSPAQEQKLSQFVPEQLPPTGGLPESQHAFPAEEPGFPEQLPIDTRLSTSYGLTGDRKEADGFDSVIERQRTTDTMTDEPDVTMTTEPTPESDMSLLESLTGRRDGQETPMDEERDRAPSLSELLIHGAPRGQSPELSGLAPAQYQLPASTGQNEQLTDDRAASGQLLYPTDSEPQEHGPDGQLPAQQGGLQRQQTDESGFQDLGSLEAARADAGQSVPSSARYDLPSGGYAYPEQEDAARKNAEIDAMRSGYVQRPEPPSSPLGGIQPSGSASPRPYQPQIAVNASQSLDRAPVAPTGDGTELRNQFTPSPVGVARGENLNVTEQPQMTTELGSDKNREGTGENREGTGENREGTGEGIGRLTEEGTDVDRESTDEDRESIDNGGPSAKDEDSVHQWLEDLDEDQREDETGYDDEDDDDGYRLSDNEYVGGYRDNEDGDDEEEEYDEEDYEEEGEKEEEDGEEDERSYLNKGTDVSLGTKTGVTGTSKMNVVQNQIPTTPLPDNDRLASPTNGTPPQVASLYPKQESVLYPQQQSPPYQDQQPLPSPQQQSIPYPEQQPLPHPQQQSVPYPEQQPLPYPQQQSVPYPEQQSPQYPQQQLSPDHQAQLSSEQQAQLSPDQQAQHLRGEKTDISLAQLGHPSQEQLAWPQANMPAQFSPEQLTKVTKENQLSNEQEGQLLTEEHSQPSSEQSALLGNQPNYDVPAAGFVYPEGSHSNQSHVSSEGAFNEVVKLDDSKQLAVDITNTDDALPSVGETHNTSAIDNDGEPTLLTGDGAGFVNESSDAERITEPGSSNLTAAVSDGRVDGTSLAVGRTDNQNATELKSSAALTGDTRQSTPSPLADGSKPSPVVSPLLATNLTQSAIMPPSASAVSGQNSTDDVDIKKTYNMTNTTAHSTTPKSTTLIDQKSEDGKMNEPVVSSGRDQDDVTLKKISDETTPLIMDITTATDEVFSSTNKGILLDDRGDYRDDDDDNGGDDDDETGLFNVLPGKAQSAGGISAGIGARFQEPDQPSSGHFMAYFVTCIVLVVLGYLFYHNRKKVMAYVLEGRSGKQRRGRGGNGYQKLSTNVEEAMPEVEKEEPKQGFVY